MFTLKHIDDLRSKPISSRNFRHRDSRPTKWICTLDSIVRQSSYPPTKTAFCTDSKSLSNHSNFKSSIYKRVLHLVSIIFFAVSWGGGEPPPKISQPLEQCWVVRKSPESLPGVRMGGIWKESLIFPFWWCNLSVAGRLNLSMEKYQKMIVSEEWSYPFQTTMSWCPC